MAKFEVLFLAVIIVFEVECLEPEYRSLGEIIEPKEALTNAIYTYIYGYHGRESSGRCEKTGIWL